MKKIFRNLIPGTPEYVVAHAQWRKQRGKLHPSVTFSIIKNPVRALSVSKAYLDNYKKFPDKIVDTKYKDEFVSKVTTGKEGWAFTTDSGGWLCINKKADTFPKVGQLVRTYHLGHGGIGSLVRGLDFEGKHCRYETEQALRARHAQQIKDEEVREQKEFEENKELLDKHFSQLPPVFQRRIERFRNNNPDFRWKYESSELELCRQAIVVAKYLHKQTGTKKPIGKIPQNDHAAYVANIQDKAKRFFDLPDKVKTGLVPKLNYGHSGNSLNHVHLLSFLYLTNTKMVVKVRGWLSVIVGSKEFGDVPREKVA